MKKLLAVAALSAALLPAVSFGDTIWSGYVPFSLKSGVTDVTLPQFDSALGTLTAVYIEVSLSKTNGSLEADNDGPVGGDFTISQIVTASLSSTDVKLLNASLDPVVSPLTITSTSGLLTFGPTSGDPTDKFNETLASDYQVYTPDSGSTSGSGAVASSVWYLGNEGYIGTGAFTVNVNVAQTTSDTSSGAINYAYVPSDVSGTVDVVYVFSPVPEPTTWAMLVGGAGLLVFGRRMRLRKA
jgi:hypothetical protein